MKEVIVKKENGSIPYYETEEFFLNILALYDEHNSKVYDDLSNFTKKASENEMRSILSRKHAIEVTYGKRHYNDFWQRIRFSHPAIPYDYVQFLRNKVKYVIYKRKKLFERCKYGVGRRGPLTRGRDPLSNILEFKSEVSKDLPHKDLEFVPFRIVRNMSSPLLKKVQELEDDLLLRIRGGAGARKPDARDSNVGHSIGLTVVTGGGYSNAANGISGSVHMNRNIVRRNTRSSTANRNSYPRQQEDILLQKRVFDVVTEVILTLYGKAPWFIAAMDKLKNIPDDRLIPGRKIPCSHIWFTSSPKKRHVHTDTNTIPPAFVFCARTVMGGGLLLLNPKGFVESIDMFAGKVVGGSWAQHPHCNEEVLNGDRHSFVVYLDNRAIAKSYISTVNEDIEGWWN